MFLQLRLSDIARKVLRVKQLGVSRSCLIKRCKQNATHISIGYGAASLSIIPIP